MLRSESLDSERAARPAQDLTRIEAASYTLGGADACTFTQQAQPACDARARHALRRLVGQGIT